VQMSTPNEVLLQILEDLGSQDFQVFKWLLEQRGVLEGLPWVPVSRLETADRLQTVEQIMKVYGVLCIEVTNKILTKMNKNQLALELSQFSYCPEGYRCQAKLREKFEKISEKFSSTGSAKLLSEVYTELYLSPAEPEIQHEFQQIQTQSKPEHNLLCTDLFRGQTPAGSTIRTVLTKGVAGVGKTVLTQKFTLDWAEGRANQDLQLLFPFTFRELNVLRDTQFSLVGLLHHFFSPSKGLCSFQQLQVLFIFDGLDECRLPLNFSQTRVLTDPTESTSLHVLLINLIRGTLLPSAHLWITTRPATASQIPAECVSMVTEVRGFTDLQKEQYFRKRFKDQATAIISHIKSIRSLYIMCHIPIFCWILSTVLQKLLDQREEPELPQTLTNLYIHFLVVQLKQKNIKYDGKLVTASAWSPENCEMVQSLGKLAFEQLQKGNLIFYESDLSECGLDAAEASVYSGVVTDLFRDESGLYEDQVYCFIHLSVQEFLAALHVHHTFFSFGKNLLHDKQPRGFSAMFKPSGLYRSAVDLALQSPTGHLDLFLRFLLGLSLEENQGLLGGFGSKGLRRAESHEDTVELLRRRIKRCGSADRSLNLLHCLNELKDNSLVQQIQEVMRRGHICDRIMSAADWSALSFLLLSSDSDLEEFDLRKYCASERSLMSLSLLSLIGCGLSPHSCGPLASALSSSSLTHLDLSNNDLQNSGVELLCSGLKSVPCRLETLRLCGCGLSVRSCECLSSVVSSNSSLKELDLSRNLLQDPGLQLLCQGLRAPHCPLLTLRSISFHFCPFCLKFDKLFSINCHLSHTFHNKYSFLQKYSYPWNFLRLKRVQLCVILSQYKCSCAVKATEVCFPSVEHLKEHCSIHHPEMERV
uniref:NACHT domain-containing protein n=1 Tax=Periophthalmus magnuspinnatus TaxID=409849 RepID=A0A3B3ZNF5_9GOBI